MAYTKKTWVTGETIQAVDLNHLESGVEAISANGAIGTSNLSNAAVTSSKIANNSITDDELADGAVVTAKIEDGAVTSAKIATAAVSGTQIADETITATNIADETLTEAKLDPTFAASLAKVDGSYEGMTVGNAEQIVSTVGVSDNAPYTFRTTGGSADVGDRMNLHAVVGGTVAWNQNLQEMTSTYWQASATGTTVTFADGVATVNASLQYAGINNKTNNRPTFETGHKVLYSVGVKLTTAVANAVRVKINNQDQRYAEASTAWQTLQGILSWNAANSVTYNVFDARSADRDAYQVKEPMLIDLTAMFGSTIADYAYTLESGTAGAGVAWLKKYGYFTKPYYPYKAAALESVKTSAHKTIGFNQFDKTASYLVTGDGNYRYVDVLIGASNLLYMTLKDKDTSVNVSDVNIGFTNLAGNGTRKYRWVLQSGSINSNHSNVSDDGTMLQYAFVYPQSADAWDRLNRRYDICVNIRWDGERDGEYEPYEQHTYALDDVELRGIPKLDASNNLYYDGDEYTPDGTVTRKYGTRAYTSGDATDGSTMITDGTNTVYKLTTPTTESADPYTELQICNDFGTEEFVDAATRDFDMPCGSVAVYQPNLRSKLEMSPNSPSNGDGDYIVRQTDGLNEYVALSSNSTISGLVTRCPACPTDTNGTFVLKATVSGGAVTYSWVSE